MTGFLTLFYFCVFVSVRLSVCLLLLFAFFFLSSFLSFFFLLNKQKNSVTSIKWQKLPFSKSKSDLIILSSCASVQPIASIFISFPSSELDAAALSPSPLPIRPPRIFLKRLSDLFFSRCQKLQALCFFFLWQGSVSSRSPLRLSRLRTFSVFRLRPWAGSCSADGPLAHATGCRSAPQSQLLLYSGYFHNGREEENT